MNDANEVHGRCEICGNAAELGGDWALPARRCPRCGTFEYASTVGRLAVDTVDHMVRLSGWVREQNDAGVDFPMITPDISRRIARRRLPKLLDRANRALLVIARRWPSLEDWFSLQDLAADLELQGRSYSGNPTEAMILIHLLLEQDHLRNRSGIGGLSVRGLLAAEAVTSSRPESAQGFVAMSFDESLREAWTLGFDPAIRNAGFAPLRIDGKDFVGGISDEIMAEIRAASFVVADYTQQKTGVYFEAGFALGLGLTVIPTCRADDIGRLHFDIKHLNTLLWKNPTELETELTRRIIAVVGRGPAEPV